MCIGIIWNISFFSRWTRQGRGSNRSSATANVTLYCTWHPSGLITGLHGQGCLTVITNQWNLLIYLLNTVGGWQLCPSAGQHTSELGMHQLHPKANYKNFCQILQLFLLNFATVRYKSCNSWLLAVACCNYSILLCNIVSLAGKSFRLDIPK